MEKRLMIGYTTLDNRDTAVELARALVASELAACVQLDEPIHSFYLWDGQAEEAKEYRLVVKFSAAKAEEVKDWILEKHPYDAPQWIAVLAEDVADAYLDWACR